MGTPNTMAPEVWRGDLTPQADIFSLGVVMYEMMCLRLPFNVPSNKLGQAMMFWKTKPKPEWRDVHRSDEAVQMCQQMVSYDRHLRKTALECLRLPFISMHNNVRAREEDRNRPHVTNKIVDMLTEFDHRSPLWRTVALKVARSWPSNRVPE